MTDILLQKNFIPSKGGDLVIENGPEEVCDLKRIQPENKTYTQREICNALLMGPCRFMGKGKVKPTILCRHKYRN